MRFFASWPLATLLAGWLALLAPAARAQHRPAAAGTPTTAGRPISEVLTPAGTLRSGITGSFDPTGYRMGTDPTTGQPVFAPNRPAGAGDDRWQEGFGLSGANGIVNATVVAPNGDVYIGGDFTTVGTAAANYVAKWDGTAWSPLGTGLNGSVFALAVSGPDVYVGGAFTTAGGAAANYVAKWNGTAWSPLGTGLNSAVRALAVSGPDVYVGGVFTTAGGVPANRVAQWNGTAWSPLGTGLNNFVFALAVSGANVYVGGNFTTAGGAPANRVAQWNGTAWSPLGTGLNNTVSALGVSGPNVYVGGNFTTAGGAAANYVARWNGTAWSALGAGLTSTVYALAVSGANVYVGGNFLGPAANCVARWNGTAWSALGTGLNNTVGALAVSGADVYVGGQFTTAGGATATYMAKWNGTAWSAPGSGVGGTVRALAVSGPDVYVGGDFTSAGGATANYVAKWNGTAWSALGTGVGGTVYALAVSGPDVYVGGAFTTAGGAAANYVAKWNGTAWSALGTGLNNQVYALAVSGPNVYVGGTFTTAGGAAANYVAKWNGTAWSALGTGLNNQVYALAVSGPDVYVGGAFTTAGGAAASRVARWNGSAWSALGTGLDNTVRALAVSGADVYVGGDFIAAGGAAVASRVARWNGTAWSALGLGVNGTVRALAVSGPDVYVGGSFGTAGGAAASRVAQWNGTAWSPLGTGLNNTVNALAVGPGSKLNAGGDFTTVGDGSKATAYFGIYTPNAAPTALGLSPQSVAENTAGGTAIGTFSTTDADAGDTHTYTLVPGTGSTDNGAFSISGNQLQITAAPDFETKPSYAIRVRTTDAGGLSFEQPFTVTVTNVNEAPTALALSNNTIAENTGANAVVGTLSTTDPDAGDTFTYTLVSGLGSTDNALVNLSGNTLRITASPDFETKSSYAVRVRTTDGGGLSFEQALTLTITDVLEVTSLTVSNPQTVPAGTYTDITVTGTGTATLAGAVVITGPFVVQTGGRLNTNCQPITGAGTFTLQAGATLGICDAAGISTSGATGAVQVTGARSFASDASYVYNGTAPQTTGGGLPATVRELEAANANGVSLSQPTAVTNVLRLTSGTLNTADQPLRLLSTVTRTAYAVHTGGQTSGNVTVQRYVGGPAIGGYRHLSSPVQSTTVADLNTTGFTALVNPAANNLPYVAPPAASFPNIFGFDETRGGTTPAYAGFYTGYFSPATTGATLTPGRGWSVFMPGAKTPDFVGALTTGDVPQTLTVTGTNTNPNTEKAGWGLLGNPYAQPIDWDLAVVPEGMSSSISVFRTIGGNNGSYLLRANGTGTLPNGEIAVGQAFFARATVDNTVFTFTNALRVEANPATVARPVVDTRPTVRLTLASTAPNAVADETLIYAETGATTGEDNRFDGLRPGRNTGTVPTLASLIDGQEAAVNGLPLEGLTTGTTTVELTAALPTAGTYTLTAAVVANLPDGTTVRLLDRQTGVSQPLTAGIAYQLTASAANTVLAGRLALVFHADRVLSTGAVTVTPRALRVYPNPATATASVQVAGAVPGSPLTLFDATGRAVATVSADGTGAATVPTRGLAGGVYVLRAADGRTTRLVVE